MMTIDRLLVKITNSTSPTIEELISKRDSRVLRNLSNAVLSPNFITLNQSRLLLKILAENQKSLVPLDVTILENLEMPSWSRTFRVVDQTKKMVIQTDLENNHHIVIEFAFSSGLRKTMHSLNKTVSGLRQVVPAKIYHADLTEVNIVTLVELLLPLEFVIEENLKNYYETIKSWSETTIKDQFLLTTIVHPNFQKQITADLGIETAIDDNIINDRSVRYQYYRENHEKSPKNLTEVIANRPSSRMWINSNTHSLDEIITSLVDLKRLPVLVVFDNYNNQHCLENLKKLGEILEDNRIYNNVGIYFRLASDEVGKEFNQFIANNQYNCQLDTTTQIVGVQNGKIPKFFLKSNWKPMSVISLCGALRASKTAAYTNCCDLVISYTDSEPLVESRIL